MRIAKFCDVKYILESTPLDENIDTSLIDSTIMVSQNVDIQQILGERLYQRLMLDVSTKIIGEDYLKLITDYIKPCMAVWVHYRILPHINYRLTNKAISEKNSDNSNPTSLETVKWLRQEVKNDAEFYSKRLTDHLKNNKEAYPEYNNNTDSELKPNSRYFSGIYTKNRH